MYAFTPAGSAVSRQVTQELKSGYIEALKHAEVPPPLVVAVVEETLDDTVVPLVAETVEEELDVLLLPPSPSSSFEPPELVVHAIAKAAIERPPTIQRQVFIRFDPPADPSCR
jgi:hypothetical protein